MDTGWIRVEQLRVGDTFRLDQYEVSYVVTKHPRMGQYAETTAVETAFGLLTFAQGAIAQVLPADD